MKKRIPAILLALCILFSAVLSFADEWDGDSWDDDEWGDEFGDDSFEEEEDTVDFRTVAGYGIATVAAGDFEFEIADDGTSAMLTSYKGTKPDVELPDSVNGVPVIGINTAMCLSNPVIETLQIPGSIQTIGVNAFAQCPKLRSVVIEDGLTKLDKCCFGGCVSLEEILLPESLEIVDDFVFAACVKLQEISFGSRLQSIGKQAFLRCGSLSKVVIPGGDSVSIGEEAFGECAADFQIITQ